MDQIKGNKKVIRGWVMYDWANSVYSLAITTAIFPAYFSSITNPADETFKLVNFLGISINNQSLYSYALSLAFLVAVFISPILSGIADYTGNKKIFMRFFCYLGSLACCSLFFFNGVEDLE